MAGRIRTLAGDTLIYGVFIIIGRFLTFMLTPLYSNYMSMAENGAVRIIFTNLAFINMLFSFGMETSFFRFYSKENDELAKKVFTHSFFFIFFISWFFTVIFMLNSAQIAGFYPSLKSQPSLIKIAAIIPFLDALSIIPFALLRLNRQAKKFGLIRFTMIVIAVAFNFFFVVILRYGIKGVLYAQALFSLIQAIYFVPMILKHLYLKFDGKLLKEMFMFGLPTLPANFSSIILQLGDRQIMQIMTNEAEVGLYSVNYTLGIIMMLVVSMFDYAWKPFYLSNFKDKNVKTTYSQIFTYFTLVCSFVFLFTSFFIKYIVQIPFIGGHFIKNDYWVGLGIVPIILAAYYFNGAYLNFAAGFNIEKKTKYLAYAVGISAISNIILNIILIPSTGIWGAAWATFIAYLIGAAIIYYFQMKVYPMQYEWKRVFSLIAGTAIVFFIINAICSKLGTSASIIIKSFGIIIFFTLLFVLNFFSKIEKQKIFNLILRRK